MRQWPVMLVVATLAGCGIEEVHSVAAPTQLRSAEHGFSAQVPDGWHVAPESLTPRLTNPVEIFSAGTAPVARPREGACAQVPVDALERVGPRDAFVTVQERFGAARFPDRAARFVLTGRVVHDGATCAGNEAELEEYSIEFRDAGRSFHVLVAIGPSAPAERRDEVLALLDSLRFEPRSTPSPHSGGPMVDCGGGPFPSGWRGRDSVAVGALGLPWVRQHAEQPGTSFDPAAIQLRRLLRDETLTARQRREARAALRAAAPDAHGIAETAVVLAAGHTATLSVPAEFRKQVSLSYTKRSHDRERPPAWGALRVADGDHSVAFRACPDHETHWIGGFVVAGAQCVPLEITVDGQTRRRNLAFGVPRHACPPHGDATQKRFELGLSAVRFPAMPQRTLAALPPAGRRDCASATSPHTSTRPS